jgi:hypothetical protein
MESRGFRAPHVKGRVRRDVLVILSFVLMALALVFISFARFRSGQFPPNRAPLSNR